MTYPLVHICRKKNERPFTLPLVINLVNIKLIPVLHSFLFLLLVLYSFFVIFDANPLETWTVVVYKLMPFSHYQELLNNMAQLRMLNWQCP